MKAPNRINASQKLTHEIQLARLRLAKLENQWKSAREHARLAKRRRKEAKETARRARKQAKLAKREVAEAKQVLAEAEKKLAWAPRRTAASKAPRKRAATASAPSARKKKARWFSRRPLRAGAARIPSPVQAEQEDAAPACLKPDSEEPRHAAVSEQPPAGNESVA